MSSKAKPKVLIKLQAVTDRDIKLLLEKEQRILDLTILYNQAIKELEELNRILYQNDEEEYEYNGEIKIGVKAREPRSIEAWKNGEIKPLQIKKLSELIIKILYLNVCFL